MEEFWGGSFGSDTSHAKPRKATLGGLSTTVAREVEVSGTWQPMGYLGTVGR